MSKKNVLIIVSRGSGLEMMTVSAARELVQSNKYNHIYISAINKYFADMLQAEFPSQVHSVDRNTLPQLFTTIMMDVDNWEVFNNEVYGTSDFTLRKDNFYDALRSLWKLPRKKDWSSKGSDYTPYLLLPESINKTAEQFAKAHPNFILFQRQGGINPIAPHEERIREATTPEQGLIRRYPMDKSEKLVQLLADKGYEVLQYALPEEPHIKGTIYLNQEYNQLFYHALSQYAKGAITIDSSLLHLAIHYCPKVLTIWGQSASNYNDCRGFGYSKAINIYPHNYKPISPYFNGIPDTPVIEFPEPEEIMEAYEADTEQGTAKASSK